MGFGIMGAGGIGRYVLVMGGLGGSLYTATQGSGSLGIVLPLGAEAQENPACVTKLMSGFLLTAKSFV
jgi:hypothetical protein